MRPGGHGGLGATFGAAVVALIVAIVVAAMVSVGGGINPAIVADTHVATAVAGPGQG